MSPWWLIPAFFVGAMFGVILVAIVAGKKEE